MHRPMTAIETRFLMENVKRYLSEEDNSNFDSIFSNIGVQLGRDIAYVEKNSKKNGNTQPTNQVNEVGFLAALGLVAALPELSKWVGKTINYFYYQILKVFGAKGTDARSTKLGDWLINSGKALHHNYIKLIVRSLKPFMKNSSEEQVEKVAGVIYYIIIAALGIASGIGASQALNHAHAGTAALESTLTAVKSSEVLSFVKSSKFADAFIAASNLIK